MELHERIPSLSDKELEALHANAVRLAESGTPKQRQQAEELLPLLGAAMEERSTARTAATQARRRTPTKSKAAAEADKGAEE